MRLRHGRRAGADLGRQMLTQKQLSQADLEALQRKETHQVAKQIQSVALEASEAGDPISIASVRKSQQRTEILPRKRLGPRSQTK